MSNAPQRAGLLALFFAIAACGTTAGPGGPPSDGGALPTCGLPGAAQPCTCSDGAAGAQTCRASGTWSACTRDGGACAPDVTAPADAGSGSGGVDGGGSSTACVPNATRACACGGMGDPGVQTCGGDGTWNLCRRNNELCDWPRDGGAGYGEVRFDLYLSGASARPPYCTNEGNNAAVMTIRASGWGSTPPATYRIPCQGRTFSVIAPAGTQTFNVSAGTTDGTSCWEKVEPAIISVADGFPATVTGHLDWVPHGRACGDP